MIDWHFNADFHGREAETLFGTLPATFAVRGEPIARDPLSTVERLAADGTRYYIKRYIGNGKNAVRRWSGLRGLLAPQRVVKEWENLLLFRQGYSDGNAGLLGPGARAWQLRARRRGDRGNRAHHGHGDDGQPGRSAAADRRWMAEVLRQVASHARRMHDEGFAHNDLKWRNLLVDDGDVPTVYLIDCPNGAFWRGPLRYRIVKDLACLDKIGKYRLSRTQRLRFYLDYAGHDRLSAADKRRIRKILKFFEGRE